MGRTSPADHSGIMRRNGIRYLYAALLWALIIFAVWAYFTPRS